MSDARSVTISAGNEADRRAQTRQQILEATRGLLAGGEAFAKLSIQRIVAAAGISRATFYLHFRTKRELIGQLAAQETEEWTTIAAPFLGHVQADRDVLAEAMAGAVRAWGEHVAVLSAIIELAEYDGETRKGWHDTLGGIAALVGQGIAERRPELTAAEAQQLGEIVVWSVERVLHQQFRERPSGEVGLLVWGLTELVWKLIH